MTAISSPAGALVVHRKLDDGAHYDLIAALPTVTCLSIHDAGGDLACIALDRAAVRQLIADMQLAAGLAPTTPTIGRGAALAGAVRRNFELLAEMARVDPEAAAAIVEQIAAHLRSWQPRALAIGATP
jgi:hypothetical protein